MSYRALLCLALSTAAGAQPSPAGFLLGVDYSEWVPGTSAIATDASGAVYMLSPCQLTTSSPFCVTKLSADGKTMVWQNNLGFAIGYAGTAMAVDPNGGVYVIPEYQCSETTLQCSDLSVYVAKLAPSGAGLAWKTAVAVNLNNPAITSDSLGQTYVAGGIEPHNMTSAVIRLNSAQDDWVVTGYTGTIVADPETAELVRLSVRTEELPPFVLVPVGVPQISGQHKGWFPRVQAATATRV